MGGGGGYISGMISTMKNTRVRKSREHFHEQTKYAREKTQYDFPHLNEAEREKVVQEILSKRRYRNVMLFASLIIFALLAIVFFVLLVLGLF